jgi:hypothetical protein
VGNGGVELVLLLGTAALALALTGLDALALDNVLHVERRVKERGRADLIPSRG